MPLEHAHIDQAEHNHRFWDSLNVTTTTFHDWIVVGMFYESVHWIEAYLARLGHHSRSHHERETKVENTPQLASDPHITTDYGVLRTESENARYWNYTHTKDQVTQDLTPIIERLRSTMQALLV